MFVFFTHTTWWPNAATAAQRTGGGSHSRRSCRRHQRARSQDAVIQRKATIVMSLDHCIHPSTLTAERRRLLLLIVFYKSDTRRKNPPKCPPHADQDAK